MSRILFVAPPLAGHVNAPLAVGRALADAGHEVAWAGPETYLRPLLGPDTRIYPTGMRLYRPQADRGMVALKSLWEKFVVPFARFILPSVDKAVLDFAPDVVAVDQHAVAGALVAHRHGLRWASLAPQSMELTRPLRDHPQVEAWIRGHLDRLWSDAGLPPDESFDTRFSPYLVIAFTGEALTADAPLPPNSVLVGPAIHGQRPPSEFDWDSLDPRRRRVLITVGTLSVDIATDFYARAVAALAPYADRVQAIANAPLAALPDAPPHVLVAPQVPMLDLLPRVDAVLCHGGLNTVCEALALGLPLVLAPIRNDQPIIANQVVAAGAGIRVRFARATPAQLGAALMTVLDEPSYRDAAARVRDSFARAGGAAAAASHLAELAARP